MSKQLCWGLLAGAALGLAAGIPAMTFVSRLTSRPVESPERYRVTLYSDGQATRDWITKDVPRLHNGQWWFVDVDGRGVIVEGTVAIERCDVRPKPAEAPFKAPELPADPVEPAPPLPKPGKPGKLGAAAAANPAPR